MIVIDMWKTQFFFDQDKHKLQLDLVILQLNLAKIAHPL